MLNYLIAAGLPNRVLISSAPCDGEVVDEVGNFILYINVSDVFLLAFLILGVIALCIAIAVDAFGPYA